MPNKTRLARLEQASTSGRPATYAAAYWQVARRQPTFEFLTDGEFLRFSFGLPLLDPARQRELDRRRRRFHEEVTRVRELYRPEEIEEYERESEACARQAEEVERRYVRTFPLGAGGEAGYEAYLAATKPDEYAARMEAKERVKGRVAEGEILIQEDFFRLLG